MQKIIKDYIVSSMMFLISLFYLILTITMKKAVIGNPMAPKVFPFILVAIGIVLSFVLFGRSLLAHKTIENEERVTDKNLRTLIRIVVVASILGILFTVLFEPLGFLLSMTGFISGFMFLINGKNSWKINIIMPILFSTFTYFVFSLLSVPLHMLPKF